MATHGQTYAQRVMYERRCIRIERFFDSVKNAVSLIAMGAIFFLFMIAMVAISQ